MYSTIILVLLIYTTIMNTYLFCVYLYEKYFYRWRFEWSLEEYGDIKSKYALFLVIFDQELFCGKIYDLKLKKKVKNKP